MTVRTRVVLLVLVGVVGVAVMAAGYWCSFGLRLSSRVQSSVSIGSGTVAPPAPQSPAGQAAGLESDLTTDLSSGFLSPGQTYGGLFTEGTVVQQTEARGGVLLSLVPVKEADGTVWNSAEVMLGLDSTAATASPVCYDYRFGSAPAPEQQSTPCPDAGVQAQARRLYAARAEPNTQPEPPDAFPVSVAGARALIAHAFAPERSRLTRVPLSTATRGGVLGAAVRVDGVCDYLWLGQSSTITSLMPIWQAPLSEQADCDGAHALAAGTLYGTDAAQEG